MSDTVPAGDETLSEAGSPLPALRRRFGGDAVAVQRTSDDVPTCWVPASRAVEVLSWLKSGVERPYAMLYDLTAIDERTRRVAGSPPGTDYTVVYHLLSFERNADVRIKVALSGDAPEVATSTGVWPAASWYEREVWDMFGIRFAGHAHLRRLLMPETWTGHPLRKDHPARATEMGPFTLPDDRQERETEALRFDPGAWGLERRHEGEEFMFLNVGPQHPGTHGVLRVVLQLDGERIAGCVPEIGYHHRGAEKMAERQTWHTFIPYTDRIDYLGGVLNNLPYLLAVEKLLAIEVPDRAKTIRVMLCELFRIASHLVWYGTYAQDVGALSPVFYTFTDRERLFDVVAAICGDRMHPNWFRIGGVAQDLPRGWDRLVREFLGYFPARIDEYDRMVMRNRIFRARTERIGAYDVGAAIDWGVTGPGLRACGLEWDFRKKRPYSGYENFEFDVPTAQAGDGYARAVVRVEEMRQSLRIVRQCLEHMPAGDFKSRAAGAVPPIKDHTMHDIETLITHFLGVAWGPVVPPGEAFAAIEASKGSNGYYLVSDGDVHPYRARIRTPSFPHMQMLPEIVRGLTVADLLSVLGSIDFVLADVDR